MRPATRRIKSHPVPRKTSIGFFLLPSAVLALAFKTRDPWPDVSPCCSCVPTATTAALLRCALHECPRRQPRLLPIVTHEAQNLPASLRCSWLLLLSPWPQRPPGHVGPPRDAVRAASHRRDGVLPRQAPHAPAAAAGRVAAARLVLLVPPAHGTVVGRLLALHLDAALAQPALVQPRPQVRPLHALRHPEARHRVLVAHARALDACTTT